MDGKRKSKAMRIGLQLGLGAAAVLSAAAAVALTRLWEQTAELYWIEAALVCAALLLCVCLIRLRRGIFGALDALEDTVNGWGSTTPEELHQSIGAIPGPVGNVGGAFLQQMDRMEQHLSVLEKDVWEKARRETKLDAERWIVRQIRDQSLPHTIEDHPSLKDFEITGLLEDGPSPCCVFYDYFYIDPGLLCVSIGELPQDGVEAVFRMAVAQTMIRGRIRLGQSLAETMADVNKSLYDYGFSKTPVHLLVGMLNTWNGQFQYVNAGLEIPLLMRKGGGYDWLGSPASVPAGETENVRYRASELRLRPGDRLFFHTGGLGNMTGTNGEAFREQGLRAVLNRTRTRDGGAAQQMRFVADEAAAFCSAERERKGFALLLLEYLKEASDEHEIVVRAAAENAEKVVTFLKVRLEENGQHPRNYARLAVLAEELFTLCCHKAEAGGLITVNCAVAPDAQSVTLRLRARMLGRNPLDAAAEGTDGQAADFICRQSDYVDFQADEWEDAVTVVWFMAN